MDKKIFALALGTVLALPGAASAEMDIKLYGQLQAEVGSVSVKDKNGDKDDDKSGLSVDDNKRGRLGVDVSEDLGNGLKGVANFEWQVETTLGEVNDGTRVGMVGLKHAFGTISMGSLKSAYKYAGGVKYDPFVATFLEARSNGGMTGRGISTPGGLSVNNVFGQHGFLAKAVGYDGKFNIVSVSLQFMPDELADNGKGKLGDVVGSIKAGTKEWEGFVAFARDAEIKKTGSKTTTVSTADVAGVTPTGLVTSVDTVVDTTSLGNYFVFKLGGKYSLKMGGMSHTLLAQYENFNAKDDEKEVVTKVGSADPTTVTTSSKDKTTGNQIFVGYHLDIGKITGVAQFGLASMTQDAATDVEFKTTYIAIGGIYKFSKATRVFGGFRLSSNKKDDKDNGSTQVIAVGLRKDFK
jgi:predicted porin